MIKKFEQYNELDPYNEERWDDVDDIVEYYNIIKNMDVEKISEIKQINDMKTFNFYFLNYRFIIANIHNEIHIWVKDLPTRSKILETPMKEEILDKIKSFF